MNLHYGANPSENILIVLKCMVHWWFYSFLLIFSSGLLFEKVKVFPQLSHHCSAIPQIGSAVKGRPILFLGLANCLLNRHFIAPLLVALLSS